MANFYSNIGSSNSLLGSAQVLGDPNAQLPAPGIISITDAVAVSPTKVRLLFAQAMLNNANLSDPSQYTVRDMFGNTLAITSATPEQISNPTTVALVLSSALTTQNYYEVTFSSNIETATGDTLSPRTATFYWIQASTTDPILLNFEQFTGEIRGGLFGNPAGLVFFSPALNEAAANSVIQVDEVDVCTFAYDTYTFPQPIDPIPLYTFGAGRPSGSALGPGSGTVLWAPFPRNFEAQINLGYLNNDAMPQATDGSASITFQEPWNPAYVALLNNTGWRLFEHLQGTLGVTNNSASVSTTISQVGVVNEGDYLTFASQSGASYKVSAVTATTITLTAVYSGTTNAATTLVGPTQTPPWFITANNLAPIPSGPTTIMVLSEQLVANSALSAAGSAHLSAQATVISDSATSGSLA